MKGKFVLDSNVVIALFDREVSVLEQISAAERTIIPIPVIGELYYGAFKSQRSRSNIEKIDALALSHTIAGVNFDTAQLYGEIKSLLHRRGMPIPNNDIWIAAVALQHGAAVATRDAHFNVIDNLTVARW
jgi:tRNA(fMet)-specific endonuclease VapC